MPHNGKHLFAGLALLFVTLEAGAFLSLSWTLSLTGIIYLGRWRRRQSSEESSADTAGALPAKQVAAGTAEEEPSPDEAAASAPLPPGEVSSPKLPSSAACPPSPTASEPPASEPSTTPPAASEPSIPTLAAQSSMLLPIEISFSFVNSLAASTSEGSSGREGEGGAMLGAVDEGGEEGSVAGSSSGSCDSFDTPVEDSDEFEDACGELVFEPSSSGVPGLRMVPRCVSGMAERTEPNSTDPRAAPLLVSSYEARLVEIINGRVKVHVEAEPAYVDQPLAAVAHSLRRTASRSPPKGRGGASSNLGPLASMSSFGSLSPGPSSAAL